jgi:uroporphyrinogen decarboxylase
MHSHGNLNAILPDLVSTGIDMLNPVGPGDGMNLAEIKKLYGSKITLSGGLSKRIGMMSQTELEEHVREVVTIGRSGGGFIAQSEGGIPEDMTTECYQAYMTALRRYCGSRA